MVGKVASPRLHAKRLGTVAAPLRIRGGFVLFLAWCVHCYTALGLVASAAIAVLLVRGGPEAFRGSFVLMLVATLVDATDGTLARRVRVQEVLPSFDGRKLDDLTDFLTYTSLPLLLIWRGGAPARQTGGLAALPAPGQRVRLLPGFGQDRRRLFPRLPLPVEHRRVLPLRAPSPRLARARRGAGAQSSDLRADPLPLSVAAGSLESSEQPSGCGLVVSPGLDPVANPLL